MTSDIDTLRKAIAQYDKSVKLKQLNQELYDHLLGSVVWLLKYSEKYSIPLPQKQGLYDLIKRSESLIDRILEDNAKSI